MSEQPETVIINGRTYDKHTGMPLAASAAKSASTTHHAQAVHQHASKSQTLSRRYVKRPTDIVAQQTQRKAAAAPQVDSYPKITKFAPHPVTSPVKRRVVQDIAPGVHPMVQHVQAARAKQQQAQPTRVPKPSTVLKQEAVETALTNAERPAGRHRTKDHSEKQRQTQSRRRLTLATGGVALLLIGAYFTYISMPVLSVKVAAAQAGVHASYPAYHPSGYGLSGAVAFQPGSVSMSFRQNGGNQGFTLTQANSGWDSGALLDNYVTPKAGSDYTITRDNGLTIYTYGNGNAAWVSGGVLYTIQGDATLSSDQIQHIATSM